MINPNYNISQLKKEVSLVEHLNDAKLLLEKPSRFADENAKKDDLFNQSIKDIVAIFQGFEVCEVHENYFLEFGTKPNKYSNQTNHLFNSTWLQILTHPTKDLFGRKKETIDTPKELQKYLSILRVYDFSKEIVEGIKQHSFNYYVLESFKNANIQFKYKVDFSKLVGLLEESKNNYRGMIIDGKNSTSSSKKLTKEVLKYLKNKTNLDNKLCFTQTKESSLDNDVIVSYENLSRLYFNNAKELLLPQLDLYESMLRDVSYRMQRISVEISKYIKKEYKLNDCVDKRKNT